MSDNRTHTGARLSTRSRVFAGEGRAKTRACEGDYDVHRCRYCNKRFDVLDRSDKLYCNARCCHSAAIRRNGAGGGRAKRWAHLYQAARNANGQWVAQVLPNITAAKSLYEQIKQRRDFDAFRNGVIVNVRLVVAA